MIFVVYMAFWTMWQVLMLPFRLTGAICRSRVHPAYKLFLVAGLWFGLIALGGGFK